MRGLILVGLAAVTSFGAYLYARRVSHLSGPALRTAWNTVLECLALTLVFFAFNLLTGFVVVAIGRAWGLFISLYDVSDMSVVVISLLQGTLLRLWRSANRWGPRD